jgi:hypothetical protein
MSAAGYSWLSLMWPAEVDVAQLGDALRVLAGARTAPVALEAVGESGQVTHRIGLPAPTSALSFGRSVSSTVPGLGAVPVRRDPPAVESALRFTVSTKHRPLRSSDPAATSRALLDALAAARGDELIILQWVLVTALVPPLLRNNVSHRTTQSWSEAILESPWRGSAPADGQQLKALRAKQGDVGWRVIGRVGVSGATPGRRRQLLERIVAALRTTTAPGAGWLIRRTRPAAVTVARPGWFGRGPLNLAELLAVSSWPIGDTALLPVLSRTSRVLAPTPGVLTSRRVVGVSTALPERRVGLSARDALTHLAVTAPTGTGKSTLLMNLVVQDIADGRGVVVFDPKGGLVDAVLARVPTDRLNDVIVVDPSDRTMPVGVNPLQAGPASRDAVADQLLAVFRNLFAGYWGPRTQDILHAALLTLLRTPGMTLAALPVLLTDSGFRRRLTKGLGDPFGLDAFWASFESWSTAERATNIGDAWPSRAALVHRSSVHAAQDCAG